MGAATLVYKDDIFGDKAQTTAPCSLYYRQVLVQQCEKGVVKYKKEPISNKNIWYHLELPANDADFKSSQAYVNGECEKAITDLYGNFSPLSSPIFTQALLSSFADQFKVTFPTQYKRQYQQFGVQYRRGGKTKWGEGRGGEQGERLKRGGVEWSECRRMGVSQEE